MCMNIMKRRFTCSAAMKWNCGLEISSSSATSCVPDSTSSPPQTCRSLRPTAPLTPPFSSAHVTKLRLRKVSSCDLRWTGKSRNNRWPLLPPAELDQREPAVKVLDVGKCPLGSISGHLHCTSACPLYPQKRTCAVQ